MERKLNIQSELLRGSGEANQEKTHSEKARPQPKAFRGPGFALLHRTDNPCRRHFYYTGWECRRFGALGNPRWNRVRKPEVS